MVSSFQPIISPDIDVIIEINRRQIKRSSGRYYEPDNLINRQSLEWALEFIKRPPLKPDPYPELAQKAAYLSWQIITRHVFFDGNKRTGILAGILLLEINGYTFHAETDEIVNISVAVANEQNSGLKLADLTEWFISHSASNNE